MTDFDTWWAETYLEPHMDDLDSIREDREFWRSQAAKAVAAAQNAVHANQQHRGALQTFDMQEKLLRHQLQQSQLAATSRSLVTPSTQNADYWKRAFEAERQRNERLEEKARRVAEEALKLERVVAQVQEHRQMAGTVTAKDVEEAARRHGLVVISQDEASRWHQHICPEPTCRCYKGKDMTIKCDICGDEIIGPVHWVDDSARCKKCFADLDPLRLNPPLYQRHKKALSWIAPAGLLVASGATAWGVDSWPLLDGLATAGSGIGGIWLLVRSVVYYARGR